MARVHCPDCEMAVVVDPNGVCPEGHLIGNAGRRIELAIGDPTPHPDEPQPWSAMVEAAEAIEQEPAEARQIRPISIASDDEDETEDSDNDMMMRELHALSDLDVVTEERAATGPASVPSTEVAQEVSADAPEVYSAPVSAPTPEPPAEEPTPAEPAPAPPPRMEEDLDAIAELAALFDAPAGEPAAPKDDTSGSGPQASQDDEGSLASVSHLPFPSGETAGATGATPPDGTDNLASGDSIDWSHFTARGKRRRFGR